MIDQDVLIQKSHELTPLSPTIVRLAELVCNPDTDIAAIAKTLSMDPALAGSVLRQANSVRFGGQVEIATVTDAVIRLGSGAILAMATEHGVRKTADRSLPEYGFSEGMFWRHSCMASMAVDALRKSLQVAPVAAAATAALLHDIGKLAMAQLLAPDVLSMMWRARTDGGCSRLDAEREILGVDHAEVGGLIVQHWRLPESIQRSIMFHHDPSQAHGSIVDIVHAASCVADLACPAIDDWPEAIPNANALARLGLQSDHLTSAAETVAAEFSQLETGS